MLIVNWLGHLVFPGIFFSISNIGVMPSNFLCIFLGSNEVIEKNMKFIV